MVSIVGLEFAYTQAPKNMKSMIMSLYLLSVFVGNMLTAEINRYIQIPSAAATQLETAIEALPGDWQKDPRNVLLPGHDGVTGTADDFTQRLASGSPAKLEIPGQAAYQAAAAIVEGLARKTDDKLPAAELVSQGLGSDPWGNPIRYEIVDSSSFRILSDGPDRKPGTEWDQGLTVSISKPAPPKQPSWIDQIHPAEPWLARRKAELGMKEAVAVIETTYTAEPFSGGQVKLQGASYFRFFTWLMLGTAVIFVPFALAYRPKTYLQD